MTATPSSVPDAESPSGSGRRRRRGRHERTPRLGPRVVLGAVVVLLAWLALAGVGGPKTGELSSLQKNDNASFLPADAESTRVADKVAALLSDPSLPLIVVAEKPQALSATDQQDAQRFAAGLPGLPLPGLAGRTVGDYLTAGAQAVAVPSKDGRAVLVVLPLAADRATQTVGDSTVLAEVVAAVKDSVKNDLRATGWTAYVTGPAGTVADFVTAFAGIDGILLLVALGVVLLILLVVYRSPVLPFAVLLTAGFGLAAAGLVVYLVADAGWITVSGQSQGILSILVVGASTDYSLLLVARYKEELHDQESTWAALRTAWRATIAPIAASAATVVLGLLALTLAQLKATSGLGPVAALGIVGAFLSATTLLPALLVLGRRWIFWPAVPRVDHVHRADAVEAGGGWGRVARAVGAHPRRTWVLVTLVLLGASAFLPTLRTAGISQTDTFLTKVDSVLGQEVLARHFDAGSGSPVLVVAPQDQAQRVLAQLQQEEGVTTPYVGSQPGRPPKVVDGQVLVQATLTAPADAPAAVATVSRLRTDLHAISPDVLVGGETAQTLDVRTAADRDIKVVIPTIIGIVFVVLVLLLRALVAPVLLVLANILSFGATMGVSALVFNHVLDFPGGDPTTVLYGFVFLVALGVDYSIFLMTRAREETAEHGHRRGVLVALTVTGGVITSAGIVLAATFGALAVLPILFLAQIAFIVAFGVLLDTVVVRSLLVPALALDLGPRTWWPGRLGHGERDAATAGRAESRTEDRTGGPQALDRG
ncbi:MMPL family transporter [Lapillicoccus jejuensis]|uniref:RND superfamily putative drug exporter n=1 Tax=Lapillicoccus jejuensis TaxID=402171 RepID=A0A542E0Q2_9MICO|nr:MMPL family transporter [Lapillicoccus jejuensis]TQJ08906.1 RND superfamily putative drug exporter [Lapillicoccus jejuensis]